MIDDRRRGVLGIVIAAPINGQVLGSLGESLRRTDRSSHLYKVQGGR